MQSNTVAGHGDAEDGTGSSSRWWSGDAGPLRRFLDDAIRGVPTHQGQRSPVWWKSRRVVFCFSRGHAWRCSCHATAAREQRCRKGPGWTLGCVSTLHSQTRRGVSTVVGTVVSKVHGCTWAEGRHTQARRRHAGCTGDNSPCSVARCQCRQAWWCRERSMCALCAGRGEVQCGAAGLAVMGEAAGFSVRVRPASQHYSSSIHVPLP